MIATRDISVGEEVVNDYGALSNSELLRAYGYVERRPPLGTGPRGADAVSEPSPLQLLRERLAAAGVPGNQNRHVQVGAGG